MSKYKDVFNARKIENELTGAKEIQNSRNTQIQKTVNLPASKPGNGKPAVKKPEDDKQVNLGIKIGESRRRFWVGQAKLRGITISEIIIEALSKKLGDPE